MFTGILQKQCQRCCLLGVDQLLHIAEVYFGFSKREAVFAMNFGFQSFRLSGTAVADGAALDLVMMRWLSVRRNAGVSTSERGYS